jgi:hypothetical protein
MAIKHSHTLSFAKRIAITENADRSPQCKNSLVQVGLQIIEEHIIIKCHRKHARGMDSLW